MELYLQFGYGMIEHCKVLIKKWGSGTVILSPRDLDSGQIQRLGHDLIGLGGSCLLDPQLYDPRADHHGLIRHEYWPDPFDTSMLFEGAAQTNMLSAIRDLNSAARSAEYIIPGIYCDRVNEDWLAIQEALIHGTENIFTDKPRLATIALSAESLRFDEQMESLTLRAETWPVQGYYLVAEHPKNQYLVEDPLWLTNLMILCAGLKLQGKRVIVGYSTQQMISLAAANIDALASGTWMNVRCFSREKFTEDEDSDRRKAVWYYCPQSLSEYKIPFLDMAFKAKQLDLLRADHSMSSDFADILFAGAQPSSTTFGEQSAFRHYLQCLHEQVAQARRESFRTTLDGQGLLLETAENFIRKLQSFGVRGQHRDFENIVDVNRAALAGLEGVRGFVLDQEW